MLKVVPSISDSHSLRSVLYQQSDLHAVSFIMQKNAKVNIKVVKLTNYFLMFYVFQLNINRSYAKIKKEVSLKHV